MTFNKWQKQTDWLNSKCKLTFLVQCIGSEDDTHKIGIIGSTNLDVKQPKIIIGRKIVFRSDTALDLGNDQYAIEEKDIVSYYEL